MKLFSKSSSRARTLRLTLIDLHTTGVVSVFRRHSFFRLWVPLRENLAHEESHVG